MSVFGPILGAGDVNRATLSVLERWLPTYLAEIERQRELQPRSIALPHSLQIVTQDTGREIAKWPEHQTPAVFIGSTGLTEKPMKDAEGVYRAAWAVSVVIVVAPRGDTDSPRTLSERYADAVRACILQHRTLEGAVLGLDWEDESYDDSPPNSTRSLAISRVVFSIQLDGVTTAAYGPAPEPPDDPYDPPADWSTVESTDVDIRRTLT